MEAGMVRATGQFQRLHVYGDSRDGAIERQSALLVHFVAEGCAPCQLMKPILDEVVEQCGGRLTVIAADAWERPSLVARFRILCLPTCVLLIDGVERTRFAGLRRKQWILRRLEPHLNGGPAAHAAARPSFVGDSRADVADGPTPTTEPLIRRDLVGECGTGLAV